MEFLSVIVMINMSNQYHGRGKQENDTRASIGGGKRKSGTGRGDTKQERKWEETEEKDREKMGAVLDQPNRSKHTEGSSPAPWATLGRSWMSQSLR